MLVPLLARARRLVAEKLGVCPFCMRTSAWGSIASWLLVAVAALAFHHRAATLLLLIPAASFSLLFLAHLVTYAIRAGLDARLSYRVETAKGEFEMVDPSRRQFLTTMAYAAGYALAISFLGDVPSFAQGTPCDGTQPPSPSDVTVTEASELIAREEYQKEVLRVCDRFCETRGCGTGSACLQNDDPKKKPVPTPPKCGPKAGQVRCTGKVKQCTCQCQSCDGDHRPPDTAQGQNEYDPAHGQGSGTTSDEAIDKANFNARQKCDDLCARFKCAPPENCTQFGDPVIGQTRSWLMQHPVEHYRAKARILKCRCKCT